MSASDDSDIYIPSVFVGETAGQIINYDYIYINGEFADEFHGLCKFSFSHVNELSKSEREVYEYES